MTKSAYVGWEQKPNSRFGSSQGLVAFPNWYCQEKEWNKKPQRSGGWGRRRIVMNSKLVWAPKWNSVSKTEGRKVGCLLAILNCLLNHLIDLLFYLKMPDYGFTASQSYCDWLNKLPLNAEHRSEKWLLYRLKAVDWEGETRGQETLPFRLHLILHCCDMNEASGPRLQQDLEEDSLGSPSDLISSQWLPVTCSMHWLVATANKGPLGVLVPKPTWRETILLKIRSWIQHIFTASLTSTANTTRPLGQDRSVKSANILQMADYTLNK